MRSRAATVGRGCYNRGARGEGGAMSGAECTVERDAVEAFILVGGRSARMGRDKARLPLDGLPLAAALALRIAPHVARVRLVAKPGTSYGDCGVACIHDADPEPALVHGIRAALEAEGAPWRWLLACDMPGIGAGVLAGLWNAARGGAGLGSAPHLPGREEAEPLPSLWHCDLAAAIRPNWGKTARHWVQAARLAWWEVPPEAAPGFANVNTPAEWDAFLVRRTGGGS
jgi:molybdenum cofactor guanylyltransferase